MWIGESFAGDGANAAHINVLVGPRSGPVGTAWATSLATPRVGYIPFLAVLAPNLPCKPATLFVNKADLRGKRHETLTWGAAQAGVARGVQEAMAEGAMAPEAAEQWCVIVAVWVDWEADDAEQVYANNHRATLDAIRCAMRGAPELGECVDAMKNPHNPYFTPKPS
jgi:5,6,7,8-tetrahydromethanopterin hydro-lyase